MNDIIKLKLKKQFPQFLLDIDLDLHKGELISLLGPSGCGKSTTLQLITGLLNNDEGHIIIDDTDISQLKVNERQIAMVFQDYALYPHLNVEKNIAYPLKIKKVKKSIRKQRVKELLEVVGLLGFENRKIDSLSGGERQRVALARALAFEPKLLLLDEPLSALDAKMRTHLRDEIRRIQKSLNITMIYVTHDQSEALSISDTIVLMNMGKVEMCSNAEDLYNNPKTIFAATFMGDGSFIPSHIIDPLLNTTSAENTSYFYRLEKPYLIENNKFYLKEILPHIILKDAKVLSCEFRGVFYKVNLLYNDIELSIFSNNKPNFEFVDICIRKKDLKKYEGNVLVEAT
jgi:ABC-type Fe3+/spermidine/putrescine transport system ATPase subunit